MLSSHDLLLTIRPSVVDDHQVYLGTYLAGLTTPHEVEEYGRWREQGEHVGDNFLVIGQGVHFWKQFPCKRLALPSTPPSL